MPTKAAPLRPIATTARTGGRLNQTERADVKADLAPFALSKADYTHPALELELGCGNGLALLERAKLAPHRLFIANDLFLPGLKQLTRAVKKAGVTNVRIVAEDARDLLAAFPKGSVDLVLIPFPDPWPKSRHHKRRLVQAQLLTACARALKPQGQLWVVTDWPDYAYHAIAMLAAAKEFALAGTSLSAALCKPSAQAHALQLGPNLLATAPAWWQATKYQNKAQQAGRGTWYLPALRK